MFQSSLRFLVVLISVLIASYVTHNWLLHHFSFSNNTFLRELSYFFNGAYAILLIFTIILLRKKFKDQIGFIFLGSTLVKIGAFLAIIKLNSIEINKSVFLDFFIPYAISLVFEVYFISKILNNYK